MGLQEYLTTDVSHCLVFCIMLAIITGLLLEMINKRIIAIVRQKPWVYQAMDLHKQCCMNFGYQEEDCGFEQMLDGFAFVLVFCGHHLVAGMFMLPVVLMGWEAAGSAGQLCFVVAALADVSLDMFDVVKSTIRTFFYQHIPWGCSKLPIAFFIMICCLHHPLAIGMVIPMLTHYCSMRAFHLICVSLLLAAGICFCAGSYKYTLDMKSKSGFMQYKAIVLIQLVTILTTRCFVWFTQVYVALSTFYAEGDTKFFVAGLVAATLMSLFNVAMIFDSIDAARKWLPRALPANDDEHQELHETIVRTMSTNIGMPPAIVDYLTPEAKHFRANVKAIVAANKFKSLSKRSHKEEGLQASLL